MTEEDARYYAKSLTTLQRQVMLLCSPKQSWGYSRLAEKTGATYADMQSVGYFLQGANLATIEPIRHGREFAGSAIFLNGRGEQVRQIVERSEKRRR